MLFVYQSLTEKTWQKKKRMIMDENDAYLSAALMCLVMTTMASRTTTVYLKDKAWNAMCTLIMEVAKAKPTEKTG